MLQTPIQNKIFSIFLAFQFILPIFLSYAFDLRASYDAAVDAFNKGQYDQSIELYKKINDEQPQFAPAYIGIGLALKAKGAEEEEVLYYYKIAVSKEPNNAQVLDQVGRLYYSSGQLSKAQEYFEKALAINPNLPEVKIALGWIYLTGTQINPSRAIVYFKDVIKISPIPNAYFGLGMAYFSDNQRSKALDMITQLKMMGQESLANKLEKAVRENRRVVINQSDDQQKKEEAVFENTSDKPKGVKVRLKGRLEDL